jgi:hypothetical protein
MVKLLDGFTTDFQVVCLYSAILPFWEPKPSNNQAIKPSSHILVFCLTFATQFKKKRYGNSYQREYRLAE